MHARPFSFGDKLRVWIIASLRSDSRDVASWSIAACSAMRTQHRMHAAQFFSACNIFGQICSMP
jgi:hypothetical protein